MSGFGRMHAVPEPESSPVPRGEPLEIVLQGDEHRACLLRDRPDRAAQFTEDFHPFRIIDDQKRFEQEEADRRRDFACLAQQFAIDRPVFLRRHVPGGDRRAVVDADEEEQDVRVFVESVLPPARRQIPHRIAGDAAVDACIAPGMTAGECAGDDIRPRVSDLMVFIPAGGFVLVAVPVRDGIALQEDLHPRHLSPGGPRRAFRPLPARG